MPKEDDDSSNNMKLEWLRNYPNDIFNAHQTPLKSELYNYDLSKGMEALIGGYRKYSESPIINPLGANQPDYPYVYRSLIDQPIAKVR